MERKPTALIASTTVAWCCQVAILAVLVWNVAGFFVGASMGRSAPGWAHPEGGQTVAFLTAILVVPVGLFGSLIASFVSNHVRMSGNHGELLQKHPWLFDTPFALARAEALFVAFVVLLFLALG